MEIISFGNILVEIFSIPEQMGMMKYNIDKRIEF